MRVLAALRDFGRPLAVVALLGVLLVGAVAAGALEALHPGVGVEFTKGVAGWFRAIPTDYYNLTGAFGLGYTASRGVEKVVDTWRGSSPSAGSGGVDVPPGGA